MSKLFIEKNGLKIPVSELELISLKEQLVLGNAERDLILRTSGKIKIQVGNKFYDLPITNVDYQGGDNGTVINGAKVIILDSVSNIDTLTYPGDGSFIFTKDTEGFYISNGNTYIKLNGSTDSINKIYLSFTEEQTLTGSEKYLLNLNTGGTIRSIEDVANFTTDDVYKDMLLFSSEQGKHYKLIDVYNPTLTESWEELYLSLSQGGVVKGDVYLDQSKLEINSSYIADYLPYETEDFDSLFIGDKNYLKGLGIWKTNNNIIFSTQEDNAFGYKFITKGGTANYLNPLSISNNNVGIGGEIDYGYTLNVTGTSMFNNKAYFNSGISSKYFTSGINGEGFDISIDSNGDYTLEIDKLLLRNDKSVQGNQFETKGLNGSFILNHSSTITRADLIETISVSIQGSKAGRYSTNTGTVMPLDDKTRWATINRIPLANLDLDGAVKVEELVELSFGIGDKTSTGSTVGYSTYTKLEDNTYSTITGQVVVDTISVYEIESNIDSTSYSVGDLLFYKQWDAEKRTASILFAEVVKVDASSFIVYCYNNGNLYENNILIKIGNKITQECFVELNSSDKNSPFIQVANNISSFNDLIENFYYTPFDNESSNDKENILLKKQQVRFKAGVLKDIVDSDLGLTADEQQGLYSDNAYIKGNFVGNRLMLGNTLVWNGSVLNLPGYVPNSRTLTINGTTYDLSADRNWTIETSGGTVTSVDMSVPTGFNIAGNPIIDAGTLALSFATGYSLPTIANQTNWSTAFSWGNHALAGYLTSFTESDPTVPSHVKSISTGDITNWNNKLSSFTETDPTVPTYAKSLTSFSVIKTDTDGLYYPLLTNPAGYLTSFTEADPTVPTYSKSLTDFSVIKSSTDNLYYPLSSNPAGYLTTFNESDPTVPSYVKAITSTNITNWNTAYGWGNHATAGYINLANNGLTKIGNTVGLGGVLNNPGVAINPNGQNFAIKNTTGVGSFLSLAGAGSAQIGVTNNTGFNTAYITVSPTFGILINDLASSIGATYSADYSATNTTNPRWIPDKAYVDSRAGVIPTLQQVTDAGFSTTNGIVASSVRAGASAGVTLTNTGLTFSINPYSGKLGQVSINANRNWDLPDLSGTIALTSQIVVTSLTTTGTSGAATLIGGVLNIPQYSGGAGGSVTSVGLTAPTGFSVSNTPITTAGNLALSFTSGYSLPTTVKQGQWDTAYGWGNHASAGYALLSGGNNFDGAQNVLGAVRSTDGVTFESMLSSQLVGGGSGPTQGVLKLSNRNTSLSNTMFRATLQPNTLMQADSFLILPLGSGTLALKTDIAVTSITTSGTSGPATLSAGVLNIPQYTTGSGGVNYPAINGMEISSNSEYRLGGDLTKDTMIVLKNYEFSINATSNGNSGLVRVLGNKASGIVTLQLGARSAAGVVSSLSFSNTEISLTDLNNAKGIVYDSDYSSNFTARSLVDKGFVNSMVTKNGSDLEFRVGGVLMMKLNSTGLYLKSGLEVYPNNF